MHITRIVLIVSILLSLTGLCLAQDIPYSQMGVVSFDSEETSGLDGRATNVLDGNPSTIWHTQYKHGPHLLALAHFW
jgi:hypothetical protein